MLYTIGGVVNRTSVHKIIKIQKANAAELGNISFFVIKTQKNDFTTHVNARSYNLENDSLVVSEVSKADIHSKSIIANLISVQVSIPAVKEGSVIEYSYEETNALTSPLYTWPVQGSYAKLESVYSIRYPMVLEFTSVSHLLGAPVEYNNETDADTSSGNFAVAKSQIGHDQKLYWVCRNMPPLKSEPYVNNLIACAGRLDIQITGVKQEMIAAHFNNSWGNLNDEMWVTNGLKNKLYHADSVFKETVQKKRIDSLCAQATNNEDTILAIYKYVRSRFSFKPANNIYETATLATIDTSKNVSITEKNIFLTGMLIQAGIKAAPVLMSTTNHIPPSEKMPVADRLNYLACVVTTDDGLMLLDASDTNNVAGHLNLDCYNGFAWVLGDRGTGIDLSPSLLNDRSICNVRVYDFTDTTARLEIIRKMGMITSSEMRKSWKKGKLEKYIADDIAEMKRRMPESIELTAHELANATNPDTNLIFRYEGRVSIDKNTNTFFINTNLVKLFEHNPLKAATRKLPIEFPYQSHYGSYLTITLPANLIPDTTLLPVNRDFDSGAMTYTRTTSWLPDIHMLTFNSILTINKTTYPPEDYGRIRDFFQTMTQANNQELVLKPAVSAIKTTVTDKPKPAKPSIKSAPVNRMITKPSNNIKPKTHN